MATSSIGLRLVFVNLPVVLLAFYSLLSADAFCQTDSCYFDVSWVTYRDFDWPDDPNLHITFQPYLDCQENNCTVSITPTCAVSCYDLKIYNRWGEILFESIDPYFTWNAFGQADGVYIFVLSATWESGAEVLYRSHFTLLNDKPQP